MTIMTLKPVAVPETKYIFICVVLESKIIIRVFLRNKNEEITNEFPSLFNRDLRIK